MAVLFFLEQGKEQPGWPGKIFFDIGDQQRLQLSLGLEPLDLMIEGSEDNRQPGPRFSQGMDQFVIGVKRVNR